MKHYKVMLISLVLCLSIIFLTGCGNKKSEPEFSQLGAICELATLKCYYHNVAQLEYGKDSFFRALNYKKIWIEYAGIVKIGIDASKVTLSKPDQNGLVKVTMPKAEVLEIDLDEDSIYELSDRGIFASVSADDRIGTLGYAQEDMKRTAKENESMLMQGQMRAKKVIEEYIQRVGAALGKVYTVEWVEVE